MSIYILSVFLSAFLLFQIQPLIGKAILPWFGGTSSVWSAVLFFFQTILTGGYAYAYWLVNEKKRSRRYRFHILLVALSLLLLVGFSLRSGSPILPGEGWQEINTHTPVWDLVVMLALYVGLPALILSANSTLVQTWFGRTNPAGSPYWLYSLSNAGSLLALLSYPVFFEPAFPLPAQAWIWAGAYLVFCALTLILLPRFLREGTGPVLISSDQDTNKTNPKIRPLDPWMWIGLSMAGSITLLSITTRLTQEVAPIPLLWVLPLAAYLITFVIGFSGKTLYRRWLFTTLLILTSVGVVYCIHANLRNYYIQLVIYLLFLFAACMIAHGELYRLRPSPDRLARFYLLVSIGGAAGGIFVNLLAPLVFNGYWEFYLGWVMLIALLLILAVIYPEQTSKPVLARSYQLGIAILGLAVLIFSVREISRGMESTLYQERNFYGVSKVSYNEYRDAYLYTNGATMHGFQFLSEEDRDLPTAYFWRDSGIAIVIRNYPYRVRGLKVGVMGLGIGTLAAHGQEGDRFRFYEIDPEVIEIAEGKGGYFSFIEDSGAEIHVVEGDARLSLERELLEGESQGFDLLVMDAFSSDSVPVHLLTVEAFELYLKHLAPGGVIAVNISNNYLDLKPVIWRQAQELGLYPVLIDTAVQSYHPVGVRSRWFFLVRDPAVLDAPEIHANKESLDEYHPEIQLWTDQFSNLFQILWR